MRITAINRQVMKESIRRYFDRFFNMEPLYGGEEYEPEDIIGYITPGEKIVHPDAGKERLTIQVPMDRIQETKKEWSKMRG